jgi:hypothetical protein
MEDTTSDVIELEAIECGCPDCGPDCCPDGDCC